MGAGVRARLLDIALEFDRLQEQRDAVASERDELRVRIATTSEDAARSVELCSENADLKQRCATLELEIKDLRDKVNAVKEDATKTCNALSEENRLLRQDIESDNATRVSLPQLALAAEPSLEVDAALVDKVGLDNLLGMPLEFPDGPGYSPEGTSKPMPIQNKEDSCSSSVSSDEDRKKDKSRSKSATTRAVKKKSDVHDGDKNSEVGKQERRSRSRRRRKAGKKTRNASTASRSVSGASEGGKSGRSRNGTGKDDGKSESGSSTSSSSCSSSSDREASKGSDRSRSVSRPRRRTKRREKRAKRSRKHRSTGDGTCGKSGRRRRRHRRRARSADSGGRSRSRRSGGGSPSRSRRGRGVRRGSRDFGADTIFGSGDHRLDLDGFISKNQLEARVAHALRTMSEPDQKKVMGTDGGENSYLLIDRVKNPNAVVMSRIRKLERG